MAFARIVLAALVCMLLSFAAQAEGQRVILVLDASGSMWGQIDGRTKMDIAKDVVGKVVDGWKQGDELGLVAYGHRKKGACDDIETLIQPGPLDRQSYMSAVKALSPKGKTPMTQAIRQAAEALKFTEQQATVILVSDGIETCDPNPCAVAEELEKMGVGLTVHTVGFGLDDKGAVAQLKCLAEKTGGTFKTANNANELQEALNTTVSAPPPAPAPKPVAIENNVLGHVMMAEGVELPQPFNQPAWEFFYANNGQKGEHLRTEYGSSIKINIDDPGEYIVHIVVDSASLELPLTVEKDKQTKIDTSLQAGIVKFSGYMDDATPMTDGSTTWELRRADGSFETAKYGPEALFLLNGEPRKMALSLGTAKTEADVPFTPGKTTEQKMTLGAGVIEVTAVFTEGGQQVPESTVFELHKFEANSDGKHDWIATDYAVPSRFKVPAGKYQLVVQRDYATVTLDAEVQAGQTTKVTGVLNAGYLAISFPADGALDVQADKKDITGNRPYMGTEYGGTFNKALNAGTYHLILKGPDGNLRAEKDFEVKAGERLEATLP